MRVAAQLALRNGDREKLARLAFSRADSAGLARRARMVLLAADGLPHTVVAERCGTSVPPIRHWRSRYQAGGIRALQDMPRSGRPRTVDGSAMVVRTLERPPERLGVTHWSSRLLARDLGVSPASIIEIWRKWNLQPWRRETFMFSTDPELEAKLTDVVGLYLAPPDNAVVVCVDCYPRHRHQEFLKFLKKVATAYPERDLHVVCDNYATHKHPEVRAWLARNPRVSLHFTPASCPWLNMVEIFFGVITRQAISRGTFRSVRELTAKIGQFIDGWNERCEPFTWTKSADELLSRIQRKRADGVTGG